MLRKEGIFGTGGYRGYLWCMTFKELALELLEQGWRAYHIEDVSNLTRGNTLQSLAIRQLIEVRVYEGKKIVFVKDCKSINDGSK